MSWRDTIEQPHFKEAKGRVYRSGCQLIFRAQRSDSVILDDDPREGDHRIAYSYMGQAGAGLDLIRVSYYEGGTYMLVGASGIQGYVAGPPLFSPDSTRFVSVSMDLYAEYEPNVIQVWRLIGQRPYLEVSVESEEWGPAEPRWEGNEAVSFTQNFLTDSTHSYRKVHARLMRNASGWGLSVDP